MTYRTDGGLLISLHEDGLEEFLLRGPRQIRRLFQEAISKRSLVSVHLLPDGLSFLSAILTLSEDEKWIFLDASPNETIHRRCLQAESLLCVTQLNKIRIQFRLFKSTEISIKGLPALAALIPEEILRLQRRDAFRLQIPLFHDLKCILPAQEYEHEHEGVSKKSIEAPVIDISAGGVSMEIPFDKAAPVAGDQIDDCYLKLSEDLIAVDLEVRNHDRRILSNGNVILRLGCSFIALPVQSANKIQRYIYQTEREIREYVA